MGLSSCNTIIDFHNRELAERGNQAFPIACYEDRLSEKDVAWHWHEEWEYAIVEEGNPVFQMENAEFCLKPGDAVFFNSKALHAVKKDAEGAGMLHSAVFHPRLIGGSRESIYWQTLVQPLAMNEGTLFFVLNNETDWQKEVIERFEKAWASLAYEEEDYENTVRYLLSAGIRILLKNTDFTKTNLSAQELIKINRLRSMMEFIEEHYREDLTVERIAGQVMISESACQRCFREMLNTTPVKYVTETRLRKAAVLLETTHRSSKEIAVDCGFNDISYFTKAFGKIYGCTPIQYRSTHAFNKEEKIGG